MIRFTGSLFHFNSIKVRLKLIRADNRIFRTQFQFHKGTIKTLRLVSCYLFFTRFQFHKGTIKTFGCFYRFTPVCSDFNSIKVRLKLNRNIERLRITEFQFHKGTIKTLRLLVSILILLYFNSIKVRLKLPSALLARGWRAISIP